MMRTMKALVKPLMLLAPVSVSATGTSATVDMLGFKSLAIYLLAGVANYDATNYMTVAVRESDDGTTFTQVADADLLSVESAAIHKLLDGTENASAISEFHYRGNKRYVHVGYTETATVTSVMAIFAVKGDADQKPPL